jgi:hypothetical protein
MLNTTAGRRLEDDLALIEEIAARPAATAKELAANLTALYEATFNVALDRYDMQTLLRSAPEIARSIFAMRLRLRDQVADWHARGFLTLAGQRALRNALRIARYATDMLGELNIRYAQLGPDEKTLRGFSGRNLNTFVNPAFRRPSSDARHAPQQRRHRAHRRRRQPVQSSRHRAHRRERQALGRRGAD